MSTPARPVMFRAGRLPGEPVRAERISPMAMPPDFGADIVLMADISEFQPQINDAAYLSWSQAVIIRAAYGASHDDRAWFGGDRRAKLHEGGARFLGIYQYVTAFEDVTVQARVFCRLLGRLNRGEYLIADIEEGTGSQQHRWRAWANVVRGELGFPPGDYSGLNFARAHGLEPVDWVAAYGTAEPSVPHKLWQFTDSFRVPGVGVADCSVFHGTIDDLAALAHGGTQPAANWTETLVNELPVLAQGSTGEDVRTLQGVLVARHQSVTVDGAFGPATRTALQHFQAAKGLAADGVCGPLTWAKVLNR